MLLMVDREDPVDDGVDDCTSVIPVVMYVLSSRIVVRLTELLNDVNGVEVV